MASQQPLEKPVFPVNKQAIAIIWIGGSTPPSVDWLSQDVQMYVDTCGLSNPCECGCHGTCGLIFGGALCAGFSARHSAMGKLYSYTLCTASIQSPFERLHALHWNKPLDVATLRCARCAAPSAR